MVEEILIADRHMKDPSGIKKGDQYNDFYSCLSRESVPSIAVGVAEIGFGGLA